MSRTHCNQRMFAFHAHGGREIVASFDGGAITSDGGGLLLRKRAICMSSIGGNLLSFGGTFELSDWGSSFGEGCGVVFPVQQPKKKGVEPRPLPKPLLAKRSNPLPICIP